MKEKQQQLMITVGSDWGTETVSFLEVSSHNCPECLIVISLKLFGFGIQLGIINN